ncbi:MAG: methylenetetrahydrofolate--tRNA-(uracil(54)-C(5))-methyltransferase (FADH(2)-oxidizing) TrmFO [Synergistota bacterium]|nr:methylenetetrahydrofolate--tRNA-(uracil(54)-C(5))-methyltransferase (FADH(2)-oxidizing) TrmFO [Synergistota bacterium]
MANNERKLPEVMVVGAGLAGSEAAWQLAERDVPVRLVEMRPVATTPAHRTDGFAELVCSNSLGADVTASPGGILKQELRRLDSLVIRCADAHSVPAGRALAVDRNGFSSCVTKTLEAHPLVTIERRRIDAVPEGPVILATGPLTSESLAADIKRLAGGSFLYFFDAVSPVLTLESLDMSRAWRGSRWGRGDDYINCPMNEEQYAAFHKALVGAEQAPRRDFEKDHRFFEGCLPVEVIASRGFDTLRFGPLRPVGLPDPNTGKDPWAVVQLRQENSAGTLYNMVGFQTNLRWPEQEMVFRMIPGLENAEFVRLGVMHRNIYVDAPRVLDPGLRLAGRDDLFLAGQITGVEGYVESTAMGVAAAVNMAAYLSGEPFPEWPGTTAAGALLCHLGDTQAKSFQPMNVNLGLFPPLEERIKKRTERCARQAERALANLEKMIESFPESFPKK